MNYFVENIEMIPAIMVADIAVEFTKCWHQPEGIAAGVEKLSPEIHAGKKLFYDELLQEP